MIIELVSKNITISADRIIQRKLLNIVDKVLPLKFHPIEFQCQKFVFHIKRSEAGPLTELVF